MASLTRHPAITWRASETGHPARVASWHSMAAVIRKAKPDWLALFAPDAIIADPVGPSMFDPTGNGHHGIEAIAAFWDLASAQVAEFRFTIADSFAAGDEVANVGTITSILPGDYRVDTDGVFVYRVGADGLIHAMHAFWEVDRAMATARPTGG